MIDVRPILQVVGILLATLAVSMFLPMIADLIEGNDDWQVFLGAGFLTLFVGMALFLLGTLACLFAWSIWALLVGRALQAFGGCVVGHQA